MTTTVQIIKPVGGRRVGEVITVRDSAAQHLIDHGHAVAVETAAPSITLTGED